MKIDNLRSLIRESINEYISEINEAGDRAACEAKITATQGAIAKRKKLMDKEGLDEDYHHMLDESKMRELKNEIKALEKNLTKLQKQLDKLNSKSEPKAEVVAEEAPIDETDVMAEMDLEESASIGGEFGGNKVPKKFKDSDNTDWVEDKTSIKGKFKDKKSKGFYELDEDQLEEDDMAKVQKMGGESNWNDRQRGLSWNSDWLYDDAQLEEERFKKGTDIGKKGKGFAKIEKAAEKEYGSKEAGEKVAGAILKKVLNKEAEETTINESFIRMQKIAGIIK
jgi:hypothetical protein